MRLGQADDIKRGNNLIYNHRNDGCCAGCCPRKDASGCGNGCDSCPLVDANSILKSCGVCNLAESDSSSDSVSNWDKEAEGLADSLAQALAEGENGLI